MVSMVTLSHRPGRPDRMKQEAPTMEKISEAKQAIIDTINDVIGLYLSEFGGHGTDKEILGYGVNCYFENKTDKMLTVTWYSTKVNGQEVTAYYGEEFLPGSRGYSKALFLETSLAEKGITDNADIKEIGGTIKVHSTDEKTPETLVEQEFTYAP